MSASVGSAHVAEHPGRTPDATYGVFDTLLVRSGVAVDLLAHVERLTRSVAQVYEVPVDAAGLAARIATDAKRFELARLRTSYVPGRAAWDPWDIATTAIDGPALAPRTLALLRCPGGLGPHKWTDRRLVEAPRAADDVLLLDHDDRVLECGSANLFLVRDGAVVTPPLDGRILPGTVRARVLAALAAEERPAAERPIDLTELAMADEVFATSSIRGVQPVVACPGVGTWPVGPTTQRLRRLLGG
jgi:para-aminobenzoate synthetase / 4-amino-4-deoxychorismate lyase